MQNIGLPSTPSRTDLTAKKGPSWHILIWVSAVLLFLGPSLVLAQDTGDESYPNLQPAGFLQQQFVEGPLPDDPPRFMIKRARVGVAGSITNRVQVNLIGGGLEPPNGTPRLVNAFVDFDVHPLLQIRTGQFLVPFGLEGPEPIPRNPAIERSVATRRVNDFRMLRDIGLQVAGKIAPANYKVAVVNGGGANLSEETNPKDVLGRIGVAPFELIEVGVSGHYGLRTTARSPTAHNRVLRWGVDAAIHADPFFLRGEYFTRIDEENSLGERVQRGGYVLGGYRFTDHWESIARIDVHDPNTDRDGDLFTALTLGASYYISDPTRVAVNYEIREDELTPETGRFLQVQIQIVL